MAHFEIWYALLGKKGYVAFHQNKDGFSYYEPYYDLVELAVSQVFNSETSEYVALIENNKIVSIMGSALAFHLYEDWSNLVQLSLVPIIRCPRCQIASVDSVFYWSYVSENKGRQSATPEKVLATVCIPTDGFGDNTDKPCLALYRHGTEIGYAEKTKQELSEFVRANNSQAEIELPDEDYYLKLAKEILNGEI